MLNFLIVTIVRATVGHVFLQRQLSHTHIQWAMDVPWALTLNILFSQANDDNKHQCFDRASKVNYKEQFLSAHCAIHPGDRKETNVPTRMFGDMKEVLLKRIKGHTLK